jgi:hypothetical protein
MHLMKNLTQAKTRIFTAALLIVLALSVFGVYFFKSSKVSRIPDWHQGLDSVENFSLLDDSGSAFELYRMKKFKGILLISYGVGCPVVNKHSPLLQALRAKFEPQGIHFVLIDANLQDAREQITKEKQEAALDLPVLLDESQIITKSLGIDRTGVATLIDTIDWKIVYRGAISDKFGYSSENFNERLSFLEAALTQFTSRQEVHPRFTEVVGCSITFNERLKNLTFDQIAPILSRNCAVCHQEGGVKPTNMLTYQDWLGWSRMSREQIRTKKMPPWAIDNHFSKLRNDPSLTVLEEQTLMAWFENPLPPANPDLNQIPTPRPIRKTDSKGLTWMKYPNPLFVEPANYQPYRYLTLAGPLEKDLWFNAVRTEIEPLSAIHHVDLLILPKPVSDFSTNKKIGGLVKTSWPSPNQRSLALSRRALNPVLEFQQDAAFSVPAGSYIVLELHPHRITKPQQLSVAIGFRTVTSQAARTKKNLHIGILSSHKFSVPAFQDNVRTWAETTAPSDLMIQSFQLHAHLRAKMIRVFKQDPNSLEKEVLISAPRYHPIQQGNWSFEKPVLLKKGAKLIVECTYDNTEANPFNPDPTKEIPQGEQLHTNEMCKTEYQFVLL